MDEWLILRELLNVDPEIEIAIKAVTTVIEERARSDIKNKCQGCEKEWASQKDHECIMNYNALMRQCVDDQLHLLTELDNLAIIVRMAKIAKQEGYILKHPDWAIRMLKCNYMDKLQEGLYTKLSYDDDDDVIMM